MKTANEFKCKLSMTFCKFDGARTYTIKHRKIDPTNEDAVTQMIDKARKAIKDNAKGSVVRVLLNGRCVWDSTLSN